MTNPQEITKTKISQADVSDEKKMLVSKFARNNVAKKTIKVAVAGNPNSGKTTIFNALTGTRQHVGNYPGVTVDKKEGVWAIKAQLPSGDYEYRFIVDDVWIKDPKNVDSVLNEFGQENSLLII